jgi:uncharacterized protein (TIGR03437 family)
MRQNYGFSGFCRAALLTVVAALHLPAQDTGVMTRVSTTAPDALFHVDGQPFIGSVIFTWPAGSKHTLAIDPVLYGNSLKKRYVFQSWRTGAGPLASPSMVVTITADPATPYYNADLTVQYAISLVFYDCVDLNACAPPGTVWVNGAAFSRNMDVWVESGSTVAMEATPNPGYVFAGWAQAPLPAIYSFVLTQPVEVYPLFTAARTIQLLTSPDHLKILADRAPVLAPATLEWGWNTAHTLGVVSPQVDLEGRLWVFRSWSDGGALTHTYQMPQGVPPVSVTAQFVPAVVVGLTTNPAGLPLTVDGAPASTQGVFWGPGETHVVAAPAHATDAAGAPWTFRGWSNGAANPQTITVADEQANTGIRLTAQYDPLSRIHLESMPSGVSLTVDGVGCRTPCDVERAVGSRVQISAAASILLTDGARLDLAGWDGYDGGALTAAGGVQRVTARYQTSYRLTLRTQPADAGTWRVSPWNGDGFVAAGSLVSVGYEPSSGMKFRSWAQDLNGVSNPATLMMDGAHAVMALLDPAPAPTTEPHVTNAAGETPVSAVAPGSIASLFGSQLADDTAKAETDPLPQSLAGVSLECAGRLLPLLYVSPGQINFQVAGDLAPGDYQLKVHRPNAAIVEAPFSIARNAPGLFLVSHADGTGISTDSPAHGGEVITALGTGFGSFTPKPLDGFRVPPAPVFAVADAVEAWIGDRSVAAVSAAAAVPGTVGIAAIRVRIPEDLPAATGTLVIRVGGSSSNSLPLTVK